MKRWLAACAASAGLALGGCRDDGGPVAGELAVRLATPQATDRAILFDLVGPQAGVAAAPGTRYRVFTTGLGGDTARVAVVAPAGQALAAGELVRITVEDTRRVATYRAQVREVAAADYLLRPSVAYALTVIKP